VTEADRIVKQQIAEERAAERRQANARRKRLRSDAQNFTMKLITT
jgi:hypothetical protein